MIPEKRYRSERLVIAIVIILLITNLGLFYRMNQLQTRVIEALAPFQIPKGLEIGDLAPMFNLPDLSGQNVSLDSLVEEELLIVFSSTSCPACQEFWPILKQFHNNHPYLKIIMISRGTSADSMKMAADQGFDFQVLQGNMQTEIDYKIPGTPYLYLLSKDKIVNFAGFSSDLSRIEPAIAGK